MSLAVSIRRQRWLTSLGLASLLVAMSGCSLRQMAINTLADALAESSPSFVRDEDPELIRDALPFALKTIEMLLGETPDNTGLLISACQGFELYSLGFIEFEADRLEMTDYRQAKRQYQRALKLYLRARGYCFRALDLTLPGAHEALIRGDRGALADARPEHVRLLYWTAASWGSAIAAGLDRPELVADLPAVRVVLERALELDPDYERGVIHDAMVLMEFAQIDSGIGSLERARKHFRRALELGEGERVGTYVTWANTIAVREQNREEFTRLLEKALAIDASLDADQQLINIIQQERASWLLDQADELFLDDLEGFEEQE